MPSEIRTPCRSGVAGMTKPMRFLTLAYCSLIWHQAAIEWRSPVRCRRCRRMIEWDENGGWRLV